MRNFDVAIIGAGPAGSTAAIALARKGYSVGVVDKENFPREKLCGDFLSPITRPILRELGVEREVLSCPHEKVVRFRLTSSSGEEVEVPLPANPQADFGLGLRRCHFDYVLLKKAESAGATILQGRKVKELKKQSCSWLLQLVRAGMIQEIQARILIGADGRNSWVAHRLKMAGSGTQGRSVGFQLHLKRSGGLDGKVEIHLFPSGYAGIVGLDGDTVNLCFAIEKGRLPNRRPAQFALDACLAQNPSLTKILYSERISEIRSTYPVFFPPRRAYDEGVLLVGDAARVNEPVTGEGIYFAMKSGLLAAETIHRAFQKDDFSVGRLGIHARDCRRAFRLRREMNSLIRFLIYRPALLSPLIRFSEKRGRLLDAIVRTICLP